MARKLTQKGANDWELAEFFGVTIFTLSKWKSAHREFHEACKIGESRANTRMERAFYERAVGYTREVVKAIQHEGKMVLVKYNEHVPPDANSGKFWLMNRASSRWSKDPVPEKEETYDPLVAFAQQLVGTALRPREYPPADEHANSDSPDGESDSDQ